MEGPLPRHGGRHAGLDLTQGSPTPRTPGDCAHRLGEVSPPPMLPPACSPCASLRRGQSKPCGLRHPPAPPRASLARAGQRLTSPAGGVSSHTPTAGTARTPLAPARGPLAARAATCTRAEPRHYQGHLEWRGWLWL